MFGEASLATGVSAPSTVKATQTATVVLIRAACFKQILASKPKLAMHLIQVRLVIGKGIQFQGGFVCCYSIPGPATQENGKEPAFVEQKIELVCIVR